MLRPATPLAVLLFAAFALLLMSVLSTPIIQSIPLGAFDGVSLGVFGLCKPDGCSPIEIGYDTSGIFSPADTATFDLPVATRTTLSAILVVHPIAALITLVMFVLAIVAHFHSPSHSARYLLVLFIVGIVDLLLCLLAFLIDILLFVPHLAWGSYLVLAATILVALGGLVACAMRRTVVSRKARKKRIAENAEMSGENFYNRLNTQPAAPPPVPTQPTIPVVSGANGGGDKLPQFASFEKKDDRSSDERVPLTARSPSERSPNHVPGDIATSPTDARYNGMAAGNMPRRSPGSPPIQFDQYGNPIQGSPDGYGVRRGPSFEQMNARGRGGMAAGAYRGRGGQGPGPGRGGYNNGYGPAGRGGYGTPSRGGYGPPGGRGGYGPGPGPRGYGGPGMRGGRTPPPGYQNGAYDRRGSPAGTYPGPYRQGTGGSLGAAGAYANASQPSISTGGYEAYHPDRESLPRAESPPPLPGDEDDRPGRAVEMDATTGSPQNPPDGFGQFGIRNSDADVAGMLALQQGRSLSAQRHDTYMSETSAYSQDDAQYAPARQAWNQGSGLNPARMPSPLNVPGRAAAQQQMAHRGSPAPGPQPSSGELYYEDVDPRFSAEPHLSPTTTAALHRLPASPPPAASTAAAIKPTNSYEDIPQGARSPAESERSNFTSISQRGVNPRYNSPAPAMPAPLSPGGKAIARRPIGGSAGGGARPSDVALQNNPDFEIPAGRNSLSRSGGGAMIPGSAYPTGTL